MVLQICVFHVTVCFSFIQFIKAVFLTANFLLFYYAQMELANVLDLYYEDQYILPGKRLLCGPLSEPVNPTRNTVSP